MFKKFTTTFLAAAFVATGAMAQDSSNQVGANTDWYVYQETSPSKTCWAVSIPKEWTAKDSAGLPKSVSRGDILFFVTYAPGDGVKGQVSYDGGYNFAPGSSVEVEIGGTTFTLFTEGDMAWAPTAEDDERIIAAMKRGATAVVTGRSSRGNTTRDTFSLLGFTASVEDAGKRCAG